VLRLPAQGPWQVRVVPNLYPAFAGHEVVVHTPAHFRSIAELDPGAIARVAEAWQARATVARKAGYDYVHALINEGRAAGSSLPHTHSQLVWFREPPPAVAVEAGMEGVIDGELVSEDAGLVLLCPQISHSPYEMRIAPIEPEPVAFESSLLGPALTLAAEAIYRVRTLQPGAPMNVWLHDGPWWHLHVVPRLTVAAGIELGAGIDINPLPPAEAAAALRAV
jgi:UDPglucose--hexose-1-phosphate uridylyltransferase